MTSQLFLSFKLLLAFLLLLGPASVNIPSALGETTVVGVSYVVGVPAVTVFNIHVSLCYCWGPAVADIPSVPSLSMQCC